MIANLFSLLTLLACAKWLAFCVVVLFLPPVLHGIIRKVKARLQGRIGASIFQPIFDLSKMLRKGETISYVTSWIFRSTSAINLAVVLLIAILTPWITFKPPTIFGAAGKTPVITAADVDSEAASDPATNSRLELSDEPGVGTDKTDSNNPKSLPVNSVSMNGMSIYAQPDQKATSAATAAQITDEQAFFGHATTASDIFLIIYMFALARLFTVLAALDAGSVFGGFGASREVTLALLVEPAIMLALASLGCAAHTSDLNAIFSWSAVDSVVNMPALWFIAGIGLFLASMVELSRMPADDPTTHLELTMVHEAMILENSGRNLALVEYTHLLKMTILLGLTGQCILHGMACFVDLNHWTRDILSLVLLVGLAVTLAVIESITVRLRWTKIPEFIAYSVAMSLLCSFIAIGVGQH